MKLSDIKGERTLTVIADVLPPISRISEDPAVAKLLDSSSRKRKKGQTAEQAGIEWLVDASQTLLKEHKDDCIAILAAIEGVTPKEYADELNIIKLFRDVADLITDGTFRTLFFSKTQTSEDTSGSASETIEGQEA